MSGPQFEPLDLELRDQRMMRERAGAFRTFMARRRTVREFSDRAVPREIIEGAVMTAASAPSGANQQPWTFACISDPAIKAKIRAAARPRSAPSTRAAPATSGWKRWRRSVPIGGSRSWRARRG